MTYLKGIFQKGCRKCIRHSLRMMQVGRRYFSQEMLVHPTTTNDKQIQWPSPSVQSTKSSTLPPSSSFFREQEAGNGISTKEINHLIRHRPFDECLPFVSALIQQRRLRSAEQALAALARHHKEAFRQWNDPSLVNALLRAHLEAGDREAGLQWLRQLIGINKASTSLKTNHVNRVGNIELDLDLEMKADALTFAIVLGYYLRCDDDGTTIERNREIQSLCELMRLECQISLDKVFSTGYLNSSEIEILTKVLQIPTHNRPFLNNNLVDLSSLLLEHIEEQPASAFKNAIDLPEVTSIPSQVDGIGFLKRALEALSQDQTNSNLYGLQEQLERDCFQSAGLRSIKVAERFEEATGNVIRINQNIRHLMSTWQTALRAEITSSLADTNRLATLYPLLSVNSRSLCATLLSGLPADVIAFVVIQELCRISAYDFRVGGIPMTKIARAIGQSIQSEMFVKQIKECRFLKLLEPITPQVVEMTLRRRSPARLQHLMRSVFAALDRKEEALQQGWIPRWGTALCMEVGALVVAMALRCLQFKGTTAFSHRLINSTYLNNRDSDSGSGSLELKTPGYIVPSPELWQIMSTDLQSLYWDPWAMPMVVPPRPWLTAFSGGYLTHRQACVRVKDGCHLQFNLLSEADQRGQLEEVLRGLDVLGRTPWRINEPILQVALSLWNSGTNVTNFSPRSNLTTPTNPTTNSNSPTIINTFRAPDTFATHNEYVAYVRKSVEQRKGRAEEVSLLCDTNYKLEIARRFAGIPAFYLPHSVDFRGRAYPIPPHLSHTGSDLSRALLRFAEGKELGERGLRWLKIHLANMAGFDKASLDERAAWTDQHRNLILRSADYPLQESWWQGADEPWQCLAACQELAAAWRSSNPTCFVSHLPCQQDGSCNGLQHYAALGGDYEGARHVNLVSGPRPADVYGAVATLVSRRIEEDAQRDPTHIAARLVGKIHRKIIKQPVMTNVYGVTPYGARQQIENRLKEFRIVEPSDYRVARAYLADLVFASLGTLFDRAQSIQRWLHDTALEIARSVPPSVAAKFGTRTRDQPSDANVDPADRYPQTAVMWTTPLGFPVLQPYTRQQKVLLQTAIQSITLRRSTKFDPVNLNKQASAFPPNFIHSLDASHMFRTALACWDHGLTFASVHDCFWTHAGSVDEMGRLLREQFVALHKEPILAKLAAEIERLYGGYIVPEGIKKLPGASHYDDIGYMEVASWRPISIQPIPPRGDFDINLVLESDYFFS